MRRSGGRANGPLGAFRHPGYRRFWIGALISSTGTWLGNLTIPYVLFQQTGSAVWVGWAAVAQFGPGLLFGPLGGSLADTRDRRLLLLATQSGLGLVAVLMWLQWASGLHEPLLLIGLLALFGVLNGINNPAWQSLVNDLVPRVDLRSAVTFNSLQFNLARAIGPALAGLLIATMGATWAFFFNAISFVVVVLVLLTVRTHSSHIVQRAAAGMRKQWQEATRAMSASRPLILAIALCCAVGLLGNPIFSLTVVFAEDVYRTGPIGLGFLTAALGVGAVLFAVGGLVTRVRFGSGARVGIAIVVLGIALVTLSLMPTLVAGILVATVVGASFLASFAGLNTAIQMLAPDALRGRILAARHMVFSAAIALGVLLGGVCSDAWGVQAATLLFGAVLVAIAVVVALVPGLGFRMLDEQPPDSERSSGE